MDDLLLSNLNSALTGFDDKVQQVQYPEMMIGNLLEIKESGDEASRNIASVSQQVHGDLDNGFIGIKTTSFEQVDASLIIRDIPSIPWMKTTIWTMHELKEAKGVKENIDTTKLEALYKNALMTVQKVGLIGGKHIGQDDIEGIFNLSIAEAGRVTEDRKLDDMTAQEAVTFFFNIFMDGYEKTGNQSYPNKMAIDGAHKGKLASKFFDAVNGGVMVSALVALKQLLNETAGHEVSIEAVPSGYASKITKGYFRAIVYTDSADNLYFNVPVMPYRVEAMQKSIGVYESGVAMRVSGVTLKDASLLTYVDYKA